MIASSSHDRGCAVLLAGDDKARFSEPSTPAYSVTELDLVPGDAK